MAVYVNTGSVVRQSLVENLKDSKKKTSHNNAETG